jgi:hypothetical protein
MNGRINTIMRKKKKTQERTTTSNHTGTDNINTRMNNLNDDRRIYVWNLKYIITLDNHQEKVQEL